MAKTEINPKYADRIEKLKEKLLTTYPEIDLDDYDTEANVADLDALKG